MRGTN